MESNKYCAVQDDIFGEKVKLFIKRIRQELDALEKLISSKENRSCNNDITTTTMTNDIVSSDNQFKKQKSKSSSLPLSILPETIQLVNGRGAGDEVCGQSPDIKRYSDYPGKGTQEITEPKLPQRGLNEFGFFSYDRKTRTLVTPVTSAHDKFMVDSGVIAIDCETVQTLGVGVGSGLLNALARISIVNEYGFCLYDKFVKPKEKIVRYRTTISGIREEDLRNATPFSVVHKEVSKILQNHILVGHRLDYDLEYLKLNHSNKLKRDTSPYFQGKLGYEQPPALKKLVMGEFNIVIQEGEHCSITDAQAAMALYKKYQIEWENLVRRLYRVQDPLQRFKKACITSVETVPVTHRVSPSKLVAVVEDIKKYSDFPVKGAPLPKKGRQHLRQQDRNTFKFFKYTELGNLQTQISPVYYKLMLDSGIIAIHTELEAMQGHLDSKAVSVSLIRVTIVNEYGFCMYDKYAPNAQETNLTDDTSIVVESSGSGMKEAVPYSVLQKEVSEIFQNHILVGHNLDESLSLLKHFHPQGQTRDTAIYFKQKLGYTETPSLQTIAKRLFREDISLNGKISTISSAQAAMACYQSHRQAWEKSVQLSHGNVLQKTFKKFKKLTI